MKVLDALTDAATRDERYRFLVLQKLLHIEAMLEQLTDTHEPPRNSGEGTAVDGPMPLAGGDERPSS